jgi:hypothetical protein
VEDREEPEFRTIRQLRRDALGQDFLLFCLAFSTGAAVYAALKVITESGLADDFWTIGLSKGLLFSGLVAGELFLLWDLGIRQGVRGHSVGKHRAGIVVVDVESGAPAGLLRGTLRGILLAGLVDLCAAALPIGVPTVLRLTTPDAWHIGITTYLAVAILLIPLLFSLRRDVADRLFHTEVLRASGANSTTSPQRRRVLLVLDVVGVLGVAAVMGTYLAFFAPFILRFPGLT